MPKKMAKASIFNCVFSTMVDLLRHYSSIPMQDEVKAALLAKTNGTAVTLP